MSLSVFVIECVIFMSVFGVVVMGLLMINPVTFVSDYPPEIQDRYYASQHKEKSRGKLTVIMAIKKAVMFIACAFLLAWMAHTAGAESFGEGLLLTYGYMLVWIAFDTFFLDWVLFANIKRIRLPGTEDMDEEYRQKWFHVKVVLPFLPIFAVGGLVIAGIMVLIW